MRRRYDALNLSIQSRDVFRAVADPTRRALFSQHVRILRDAGLVRVRQAGRYRLFGLNAMCRVTDR